MAYKEQEITTTPVKADVNEELFYTPTNFLNLLTDSLDYDESHAVRAIKDFALRSKVEFAEPTYEENEITRISDAVEQEISGFIMNNSGLNLFDLMGSVERGQIQAIYNTNNLLHFAQDIIQRCDGEITQAELDKIYRYRTILKRFDEFDAKYQNSPETPKKEPKVGAKTWAGYIRKIADDTGVIDLPDHKTFSGDTDSQDPALSELTVDGVHLRAISIGGRYVFGERP